jgi:NADH-quinone oxidoreductase subunit G
MSTDKKTLFIDGKEVAIEGERNVLEIIRKLGIDVPTFCYHSELSIYGACRMCTVDVEGRGLQASCSTPPEAGLKIKTNTPDVQQIRKIAIELLLANHDNNCTTCNKSTACRLQDLAKRLGVREIRYKQLSKNTPKDISSHSLVRDPNKCILCGDCVRMCDEVQGIGAIDFAHRGHNVEVGPAFDKDLSDVDCILCGQCSRVCPTGALTPKQDIKEVWKVLFDKSKYVVACVAPAVRVALGEEFGFEAGEGVMGQMTAALKKMGFDQVYDTSYSADLTILEEGTEFLSRLHKGEKLPIFTSCCPAWVKTAEQYYPELLENLSSCKSPQQMLGSVVKDILPKQMNKDRKDVVVVSIMPCVAKKFEAKRPEMSVGGNPDVDYVLTTQELAQMIKEQGIDFKNLQPESIDLPFGFKTGAGVLFANSGGVTEAVLRFAYEKVTGKQLTNVDFTEVRNVDDVREVTIDIAGTKVRLAVVNGIKKAKEIADKVKAGTADYHIIEIMACPGGCIGGGGQPVYFERKIRDKRTQGIYAADKMHQVHKSQENPYVKELYEKHLGEPNSHEAHELLHTEYQHRRRLDAQGFVFNKATAAKKTDVKVCVGTNCYLKGSQDLLHKLTAHVQEDAKLKDSVEVRATFCLEQCGQAPNVMVGDEVVCKADFDKVKAALDKKVS